MAPIATPSDRYSVQRNGSMIDIGFALELVAAAVAPDGEPGGIVHDMLALAEVDDADLEKLRERSVRELYQQGSLRVRFTLGALAVLDAAEKSQSRGHSGAVVLDDATRVAARFVDLLPDTALAADTVAIW